MWLLMLGLKLIGASWSGPVVNAKCLNCLTRVKSQGTALKRINGYSIVLQKQISEMLDDMRDMGSEFQNGYSIWLVSLTRLSYFKAVWKISQPFSQLLDLKRYDARHMSAEWPESWGPGIRLVRLPLDMQAPGEPAGRFKNAYELLNLRALKISMLYKNHIFQYMG